jgi:hypothetical protein
MLWRLAPQEETTSNKPPSLRVTQATGQVKCLSIEPKGRPEIIWGELHEPETTISEGTLNSIRLGVFVCPLDPFDRLWMTQS